MAVIGVKIELEGAPQYKENMANLNAQTKLYQAQLKALDAQMGKNVSAFTKSITESKALEQELEALKNKSKLLEEQIAKQSAEYGEDSTQVIRLRTQYQNLQAQIADVSNELQAHGGTWGAVGAQLEQVGQKIQAVGDKIAGVGDSLTQKVSAPLAGIAAASIKTAATFESSMADVAATMGYTVDELNDSSSDASKSMKKLEEFARKMGATTAFSASEAASALNYMALAGYSAEEAMQMLPTVLNLAAAGGIELASASDMITDAQSALGLSFEETAAMVDQMATAASSGNTSVEQLGQAILTIGATASNMSGGTAELATALTVLADNSIKGAEGGTKLRNIMLALQKNAKDGAVDFGDFSVKVYDAEGNMRGITDIMQDLSSHMEGMTQEAKDAITSGIFNKQDLAAANALLQTSAERFDELKLSINEAQGSAEAMANTKMATFEGEIKLLKSALEEAGISIGQALMPYIQQLVAKVQEAVDWFNSLSTEQQDMVVHIGMIVAAIGPLLSIIGRLISSFGMISQGIGQIMTNWPLIMGGLTKFGTIITGTVIPAIGGVISALLPFLPVILAVSAAIAGIILVVTHWGEITDWIQEKWAMLTEFLSGAITMIQEFFTEHFGILGELFATKIEIIKTIIKTAIEAIKIVITTFGQVIKAIFTGDWDKIGTILKNAWTKLKETVGSGITHVVNKIKEMGTKITDKFSELKQDAIDWGKHLIQNFIDGITAKWEALKTKVSQVAQTVKDFLGFTEPEMGPMKNFNTWPRHMMENYAKGIDAARYLVRDAITDVAQDVTVLANPLDVNEIYTAVRAGATDADLSLAIGDREFKRTLREMGVLLNGQT